MSLSHFGHPAVNPYIFKSAALMYIRLICVARVSLNSCSARASGRILASGSTVGRSLPGSTLTSDTMSSCHFSLSGNRWIVLA